MASELKVDKFTGVTTAGSILVTGEGNSTTTNLQQGLGKHWVKFAPDAGLFRIGASACTSVGVKYGGEKYNTFKDTDMPVQVDLSLSFKEMIIHDSKSFGDF